MQRDPARATGVRVRDSDLPITIDKLLARVRTCAHVTGELPMIRKLPSGGYRLYSRKVDPRTGKRRNLGTFATREKAEAHERAVQYFKHRG